MSRSKSKVRIAIKFVTQFLMAAIVVTGLWFAGVGFSRTLVARAIGGDEPNSRSQRVNAPKGFRPQPGQTYIPGKNGSAPQLVHLGRGDTAIDWHAWTGALHIVLLVALIAFVLSVIERGLRRARRRLPS
jgi:hypothetical protein